MNRAAVFLGKDGTLIEDVPHNVNPDRIRLAAGAQSGLMGLHAAGFRLIVITNQSGVALGRFSEAALEPIRDRLVSLLAELGVPLSGFYYCSHHPDGQVAPYARPCRCRKPQPGLITRAAREQAVDLSGSWFIGDILDDIEAGRRAGCRTILIDNGNETLWLRSPFRWPHALAADLDNAACVIVDPDARGRLEPGSAGNRATRLVVAKSL
jgi:histidinol-phosphate phosphatase family protein